MDYFKKIIVINNKKFLIQSVMKLGSNYNLLGFWETTTNKWSSHVHSITLTPEEFFVSTKDLK